MVSAPFAAFVRYPLVFYGITLICWAGFEAEVAILRWKLFAGWMFIVSVASSYVKIIKITSHFKS